MPEEEAQEALEEAIAEFELPADRRQAFFVEEYLQAYLEDNWTKIDYLKELDLWSPDARPPREFHAGETGRIDFLAHDPVTDAIVVVELKRGLPSDSVVGQTARYMGWVRQNLARPDQRVDGLIIVGETDQRLLHAVSVIPGLRVMEYRVNLELAPIALPTLSAPAAVQID